MKRFAIKILKCKIELYEFRILVLIKLKGISTWFIFLDSTPVALRDLLFQVIFI